MFTRKKSETALEREINRTIADLENHPVMSDEYGALLDRITKLEKMKGAEKPSRQISPDTLLLTVTNLVGIAMIIHHERVNMITSKATGFVMRTPTH